jgi:hypothetical protein
MTRTVTIGRRFCGPPSSGNGGYVAGLLAAELGGSDCEVMLKAPPPLERPLRIERDGAGAVLADGDKVVASAMPAEVAPDVPPAPSAAAAAEAVQHYAGFTAHPFPACFVCGPERAEGDGLRIFPGPAAGGVAAPFATGADLCREGELATEFVWAALDCPGYFSLGGRAGPAVLGKMAVHVAAPARCGEALTVLGWPIESSGRKHRVGTALFRGGEPLAWAAATWISIGR